MKSASVPLGLSVSVVNRLVNARSAIFFRKLPTSHELSSGSSLPKPVLCNASLEVFPTVSPEILVREARIEDCWKVAETHCSSFFPQYSFPLDLDLRINRLVGMLAGFSVPSGRNRVCLVAVTDGSANEGFLFGNEDIRIGGLDGRFSLNKGYVAGIWTVDTVADFLPRKGPLRQRRTGIAYVSNVVVREKFRRQGIAKKLVAKSEAQTRSWGCRAIALHCDMNNPGATKLYRDQGFKCIKVTEGANWPRPLRFCFSLLWTQGRWYVGGHPIEGTFT